MAGRDDDEDGIDVDTDLESGVASSDPSAEGRVAVFRVSYELLAQALMLPPGAEILSTSDGAYFGPGVIAVRVASAKFPPVVPGEGFPAVCPTYRADYTRQGERHLSFAGWDGPH